MQRGAFACLVGSFGVHRALAGPPVIIIGAGGLGVARFGVTNVLVLALISALAFSFEKVEADIRG
jgi:hypothetical protein